MIHRFSFATGFSRALRLGVLLTASFPLLACDRLWHHGGEVLTTQEAQKFLKEYALLPPQPWIEPDANRIPAGAEGELVRRGIALLEHTPQHIGPHAPDPEHRLAGNNLNCSNCHQAGPSGLPGTKQHVLPFINAVHDYPRLDVKSMRVITLEERVVGMMGHGQIAVTPTHPDVVAIVAYMEWLGRASHPHQRMVGTGLQHLPALARAADPVVGKQLYTQRCMACHGATGEGIRSADFATGGGYQVPPIAGEDTFDDGGHMYLVPVLAAFLHAAMPLGAQDAAPMITVEEAYDLAAYVDSDFPRRHSSVRGGQYPNPNFRPPGFCAPEALGTDAAALARAKFGPFPVSAHP